VLRVLRHNWFLKVVSLGFALLVFLHVRGQEFVSPREYVVWATIPVPANHELITPNDPRPAVTVRVRGPTWLLDGVRDDDWRAEVDLSRYEIGMTARVPVRVRGPSHLRPPEVSVEWEPQTIEVRIEAYVSRALPVRLENLPGLPAEWAWRQGPTTHPPEVTVSGLRSNVERVARVVAPLTLIAPADPLAIVVPLQAIDRNGRDVTREVTLDPATVRVTGRLVQVATSKRVFVHVEFAGVPPEYRPQVTVEPSSVVVYGTPSALRDLKFLATPVIELPPGQLRVQEEVTLTPPPGITRVQPRTVRVTLQAVARSPSTAPAR